jgi:HSP20 family protein
MNKKELMSFEPERNLFSLRDAMNHLFDESFWSPFDRDVNNFSKNAISFPKVDITENENEVVVTANVPGLSGDEINVEISDGILTISGQINKEHKEEDKKNKCYRYEREYGSFSRSFSLPIKVDEDKIDAETKNGVLIVKLPKNKDSGKKIQVKVK